MPKLATPVQYESSIEGLNDIRPLQLADVGKIVIPYPVLCKNPPSKDRPAVGMFARCSQQGALLKKITNDITTYELIRGSFSYGDLQQLIQFAQKVSFVVCVPIAVEHIDEAWWTDSSYAIEFWELSRTVTTKIPFAGTDLYIKVSQIIPIGSIVFDFYGFY